MAGGDYGCDAAFFTSELTTIEGIRANSPVFMCEREVALFVGICPRSVRKFTARKLFQAIRLGRRRLNRRYGAVAALNALETGR